MLRPWVVYTLLWIYKGGLAAVLAAIFYLHWRRTRRPLYGPWITPPEAAWIVGAWLIVAITGWVVAFRQLTFHLTTLYGLLYLVLLPIHPQRRFSVILVAPALCAIWFGYGIVKIALDDRHNATVAYLEQPLTSELLCRAYPLDYDSIRGTRLALLRRTRNCIYDDIVDQISTPHDADAISCTSTPGGKVSLKMQIAR